MITSHGPRCDVCGCYILGIDSTDRVEFFTVEQIPSESPFCCHSKCKLVVINCAEDWHNLPGGPLRALYEEAMEGKG